MKGYRFIPDAPREPWEASQLATCRNCGHRWIHKFMTTMSGCVNSTFFDACDACWDESTKSFRTKGERIEFLEALAKE